jgi:RNA polymerase sigma factor (sigma-70 family)
VKRVTPLLSTALLRTQTDERLLRLAAGGHDRAFEAIVERYRRPLLRYVRRLLPDGRAEDVVQAAFMSAWSSLRGGAEVRDLRPWLYRIAHNGAVNVLKRAGEHHDQLADTRDGAAGPEIEVERRDDVRRALHGIAALPSRQRAALLAVAVEGRSHTEVAAELGLSDGALRQLVHRARTSVRAVATLLTPPPVAAAAAASHAFGSEQVAEIAAGAGGAGLAAASLKTGAVVLTAGALVTGAPRMVDVVSRERPPAAGRAQAAQVPRPASPSRAPSAGDRGGAPGEVSIASSSPRRGGGQAAAPKRGGDGGIRPRGEDGGDDHSGRPDSGGGSGSSGGGSSGDDDHRASATPVDDRSGHDGSDSGGSDSGRSGADSGHDGSDSGGSESDDAVVTASVPLPAPTSGSGSDDSESSAGSDLATSGSRSETSGSGSGADDEVSMP